MNSPCDYCNTRLAWKQGYAIETRLCNSKSIGTTISPAIINANSQSLTRQTEAKHRTAFFGGCVIQKILNVVDMDKNSVKNLKHCKLVQVL